MKVVDLHPEELIDKLFSQERERELSQTERARLDAHLAHCSACRLEIGVRADLQQEMPMFEERPQLALPAMTARMQRTGAAPRAAALIRPRSRRRWPLVMLAAALVLCAGGATAAVLTGTVSARWLPWVAETKVDARPAAPAKVASKSKRVAQKPTLSVGPQPFARAEEAAVPPPAVSAEPASSANVASAPVVRPANRAAKAALAAPNSARSAAVASFPSPASDATAPRANDAGPRVAPAASLFAAANAARRDGNADRAVSLYRALQSRYPSSAESELSRALLAQLLLDRGSPEAALAGFDRYLAEDAPVLGAEALVGRARALEQLGKTTQAAAAWREVQTRFAGSVHARLAATRLAALGMR
ncbi:MAG: tetratricopeptide repeat protein [Polyangiaceae bacterium]